MFQDPSASALVAKAQGPAAALTEEERDRYSFFLRSFARRAENLFFQSESEHIDPETVRGLHTALITVLA
ncbi:MAG: hypothetical protein GWO40_12495, partial [Gammaproteobacteria bacterium]|nr:hypothetical protein [Gammaproteobacteria bacterium]NIV51932.1 hypothetical protein [Gammaproteobacteria bacterium]NIX86362.1 hypothetical protein [Gammaproteobacteria bacterium]